MGFRESNGGSGAGSSVNPARLASYLPIASPYTTPVLDAGTPTKLLLPTKVKTSHKFTLDAINERYFYDSPGVTGKWFVVHMTTGISSSASNHTVTVEMYKNGVVEEGVGISRWISGGADQGAIALNGVVQLSDGDYIEVYVTDSTGGTITFSRGAITINEMVGAI